MKKLLAVLLATVMLVSLLPLSANAEGDCDVNGHSFSEATCIEAKKCFVCGIEEGDPLGHDWQEATCQKPKTCKRCKITEGKVTEHELLPANCKLPKRCKNCDYQIGKPAGHKMSDYVCGKPYKCINCNYVKSSSVKHVYGEDWDDTCNRCGHVRKVKYDYVISVGETLTIKSGDIIPTFIYAVSDEKVLKKTGDFDSSSPTENTTDYRYCIKGVFVGRKAGAVCVYTRKGTVTNSWYVKVVSGGKPAAKPAAKSTTKTTAKPVAKPAEKTTTEITTKPTTEVTDNTTEPVIESTTSIPVSTGVTAKPVPKKPDVWPYVAGGVGVLIVAGAILFFLKKKK